VRVCVRPPGVDSDVGEWADFSDDKEKRLTSGDKVFAEEAAKADIIFVFDENAPAESVYYFVKDAKDLSCPNKPPPKPYDQVVRSGQRSTNMLTYRPTLSKRLHWLRPRWKTTPPHKAQHNKARRSSSVVACRGCRDKSNSHFRR
jgi:hypothetical protein